MTAPLVGVAAAVMIRGDRQVLLAQRPPGKAYAGYWEFPGGKIEPGETPHDALVRELREELGVAITSAAPWLVQRFVYPHAHVELHFFRVFGWTGKLTGHDGQAFAWQRPGALTLAPLLPANATVLRALQLPPVYAITNAADGPEGNQEEAFLERLHRALAAGLRLIAIREKTWPAERRDAFARRVLTLAHAAGARVLLNGEIADARRLGCDGVHWSAAQLAATTHRPADLLVAASCHTRADLERAADVGVDFVVLGPVKPTATHPGAPALGWQEFAQCVEGTRVPVYALGGLAHDDLAAAISHGAHGVALRTGAWPAGRP